jgi:conjugative transposon TraK protein
MKQLFDIQRKFRFTVYVLLIVSLGLIGLSGYVFSLSIKMMEKSRQKIYVLDNGKSLLMALREDISENRDAEARDHVKRFHELFFTLEPDKQYIENNVREALYLADRSAMEQYESFKENNVYNQVIASDISMTTITDSISLDFSSYPYGFTYFGKQKIVRTSNITIRHLQTSGQLRNISRTDHNPHGFLIESWRIVDNRDLETTKRKSF